MQQACHVRADTGCEHFRWARAQEMTENTEVFGGARRTIGDPARAAAGMRERARTTAVRLPRVTALLWVSSALDQRVLEGSLTTACRC